MKTQTTKLFDFPIKTFDPKNLLEEMLNAEDGTVFVLGEKFIPQHEGDDICEITMVQVKKSRG
jgi:hypothetical protein